MKIKLYARVENNIVTHLLNTIFDTTEILETDILIGEGNGDDYAHPQAKWQLLDANYCHNYKMLNGEIIERTAEEKQTELDNLPKPQKTQIEILQETVDVLTMSALGV